MSKDFLDKLIILATSAFGFVAALAWNNAVTALFNKYYHPGEGVISLFVYAIIVTIIAVFVITKLSKIIDKIKK